MTLDIAMGGSTNTILHTLAIAHEGEIDFSLDDIDALSRRVPCICKVAPNSKKYHIQDVNRAGGIMGILNELAKAGLVNTSVHRADGRTLAEALKEYDITNGNPGEEARRIYSSAPGNRYNIVMASQNAQFKELDTDRENGCIRSVGHAYTKDGGLAILKGNIAEKGCVVKTAVWMKASGNSAVLPKYSIRRMMPAPASLTERYRPAMWW
jgi:dihydroxy-acid dehydratase